VAPRVARTRLDELLVARGLLPDLPTARSFVLARKVKVDDRYVTTPGTRLRDAAELSIVGETARYASRGGMKLEAALERFEVDVVDACALDAGASTGGFTDCLLQRGASRVFAVDAGFGQLRGRLAADPRVVSLERTNIADLERERFEPPLGLAVLDLSYLSLTVALPIVSALFVTPARIVCLLKPLFEGLRPEDARRIERMGEPLARVRQAARDTGLEVANAMASPILGSHGTLEFLLDLRAEAETSPADPFPRALEEASRLLARDAP
jgi:23S rRNA (cytidine1920-2'-O)/16S rRNA (cytidine1409-2'-O)-methyltransferase